MSRRGITYKNSTIYYFVLRRHCPLTFSIQVFCGKYIYVIGIEICNCKYTAKKLAP